MNFIALKAVVVALPSDIVRSLQVAGFHHAPLHMEGNLNVIIWPPSAFLKPVCRRQKKPRYDTFRYNSSCF